MTAASRDYMPAIITITDIVAVISLVISLGGVVGVIINNQSVARNTARKNELDAEIANRKNEMDATTARLQASIDLLNKDNASLRARLDIVEAENEKKDKEISDLRVRVRTVEDENAILRSHNRMLVDQVISLGAIPVTETKKA